MTAAEWQAAQSGAANAPPITIVNQQPQGGGRVFSEEDVARIRSEEKDKLYGRMTELEGQLGELAAEREARQQAEQAAAAAQAEAERVAHDAETDVRQLLQERETVWEQRFIEMQQDRERERALREQEQRFSSVQIYRRDRIEQEQQEIMPELRDLIQGSTEEEVEQAIAAMKQRTAAILASVQGAVTQQRQQMRGAAVTAPPVGPMEQQTTLETLTPDDIRQMDMTTYAKYRDSLLKATGRPPAR